jgi:hypothetical protein
MAQGASGEIVFCAVLVRPSKCGETCCTQPKSLRKALSVGARCRRYFIAHGRAGAKASGTEDYCGQAASRIQRHGREELVDLRLVCHQTISEVYFVRLNRKEQE